MHEYMEQVLEHMHDSEDSEEIMELMSTEIITPLLVAHAMLGSGDLVINIGNGLGEYEIVVKKVGDVEEEEDDNDSD